MRAAGIAKIFAFALALAVVGRFSYLEFLNWRNERLTADLCAAAGNYLETGNLREAFEALEYGASRIAHGKACISVLDNGRSFAPNCVEDSLAYQTVTCRAEANKGVRAQVMYPSESLLGHTLLLTWAAVGIVLLMALYSIQGLVSYLGFQLVQELRLTLLGNDRPEKRRLIGRISDFFLERSGVLSVIRSQALDFEKKIRAYEYRLISEVEIRKQKEDEIAQSRKYTDKIKIIRHDIRSPLSGLLAVQEAMGSSDDLLQLTLASVVRSLRDLVEKFGSMELEEMAPRLTIVEVVAEEALRSTRMKFQKGKNVGIRLQYDRERLSPVFAISGVLRRIFENLLENSFDAVSANGSIEIKIVHTKASCRIFFEDNGCGIPPEALPRLFREGATFGKVGGTGLGLYQARQSLEAWGGSIAFEPRAEGGARFVLTIPLAQAGVLYKGAPLPGHALVVDDDPKVASTLIRLGYDVMGAAESFEEGLMLLRQERTDSSIVLIDQDLGGKNGTDLIAELSNRRHFYLCTNDFDNDDVVRRAREVGVSILPKPLLLLPAASARVADIPDELGRVSVPS